MKLIDFMNFQRDTSICRLCTQSVETENATPSCCEHAFHINCLNTWTDEHRSDCQCKCPIKTCGRTYTAISIRDSVGGAIRENISLVFDKRCPICCEDIQPPVAVPESCNHHFCVTCLSEWAKVRHDCPLDRIPFELMLLSAYIGGPIIERRPAPPAFVLPPVEEDTTICEICHSPEDEAYLLLCDGCDKGYHTYCLPNPLSEIPEGDWFCSNCESEREQTQRAGGESINATLTYSNRRQSRLHSSLADLSAEETSGSGESEGAEEEEGMHSCLHYLTAQSQERLARIAERRHRGTGLLRDLIEHLSARAEREQLERRCNRRLRLRRRVRLAESFDDPPHPSSPVTTALAPPSDAVAVTNSNSGRLRKRRRVVGFSSSNSEEDEASPSTSPRTRRHDVPFFTTSSPSSSRSRLQSTPAHSTHNSSHPTSASKSSELDVMGPSKGRVDDSCRDIFASFTTDPNLSTTGKEAQERTLKKIKKQPLSGRSVTTRSRRKKRKIKRRLKVLDSSLVSRASKSVRKSRASVKQKESVNKGKKRKRLRLNSSQRSIKNALENSTMLPGGSRSGRKTRGGDLKLFSTSKLSVMGNSLNCGLPFEAGDDSEKTQSEPTPVTTNGIGTSTPSTSTGLLSRIEAAQSSMFRFSSSNMHVNPDNSLSPVKAPPPPQQTDRSKTASEVSSNQPPPATRLVTEVFESQVESPTSSKDKAARLGTSTWTSESALHVRSLLVTHLRLTHPSLTDKATKMRLIQRALSKVLAKKPNRVTEEKIKKLVDDYVNFYHRNPL